MSTMKAFGLTHVGKMRRRNEDAYVIIEHPFMALVSDGMGGAPHGDVASRLTLNLFSQAMLTNNTWTHQTISDAVQATNHALVEETLKHPEYHGMGATLVAYLNDGQNGFIVNVGDSRAYGLKQSHLVLLSEDHNVMNEMMKYHQESENSLNQRFKHMLTSVIGMPAGCMVDVIPVIDDYDMFLLCSDGLSNLVDETQLQALLAQPASLETKAQALIEAANQAGGLDNITVIVIDVRGNHHE